MKNISRSPKFAAAAISDVIKAIKLKPTADYGDWLFAMMRKGFTKDESAAEFKKTGFTLAPDGKILITPPPSPMDELRKLVISHNLKNKAEDELMSKRLADLKTNAEKIRADALKNRETLEELRKIKMKEFEALRASNQRNAETLRLAVQKKMDDERKANLKEADRIRKEQLKKLEKKRREALERQARESKDINFGPYTYKVRNKETEAHIRDLLRRIQELQ